MLTLLTHFRPNFSPSCLVAHLIKIHFWHFLVYRCTWQYFVYFAIYFFLRITFLDILWLEYLIRNYLRKSDTFMDYYWNPSSGFWELTQDPGWGTTLFTTGRDTSPHLLLRLRTLLRHRGQHFLLLWYFLIEKIPSAAVALMISKEFNKEWPFESEEPNLKEKPLTLDIQSYVYFFITFAGSIFCQYFE